MPPSSVPEPKFAMVKDVNLPSLFVTMSHPPANWRHGRTTSRSAFNRRVRWQEKGPAKDIGGLEPTDMFQLGGAPQKPTTDKGASALISQIMNLAVLKYNGHHAPNSFEKHTGAKSAAAADEQDEDSVEEVDPDRSVDNLTKLRRQAGLPELIEYDLPSASCQKMLTLVSCTLVSTSLRKKNTLLRVIPTMTFQNSLLTPLLSEAFVTGLLPN